MIPDACGVALHGLRCNNAVDDAASQRLLGGEVLQTRSLKALLQQRSPSVCT